MGRQGSAAIPKDTRQPKATPSSWAKTRIMCWTPISLRPHHGKELRTFLRRWVAPAISNTAPAPYQDEGQTRQGNRFTKDKQKTKVRT